MQDLWSFATKFYARADVQSACLQLQTQGCDVCILLTAAWLQHRNVPCHSDDAQALKSAALQWQREVISPLRALRQMWKPAAAADAALSVLREQVKGLELNAEQILLERLQALCSTWPARTQNADEWLYAVVENESAALHVLRGALTLKS